MTEEITWWDKTPVSWWDEKVSKDSILLQLTKGIVTKGGVRSVLDVGCGVGTHRKVFEDQSYFGIDIAPQAIVEAKVRFPESNFVCGDILTALTPFDVDMCFVSGLLEYLPDFRPTLKKLFSFSETVIAIFFTKLSTKEKVKYLGRGCYENRYRKSDVSKYAHKLGWTPTFYWGTRSPEKYATLVVFRKVT